MKKYLIILISIFFFVSSKAQTGGGYTPPASGGGISDSSCLYIGTRTNILSLEATGQLTPGCFYQANDITWIIAGGTGSFTAQAIANNKLSESGVYTGSFNTNNPFEAVMNWSNGQVTYIYDNLYFNLVTGAIAIQKFPFGNSQVQDNKVYNTTLNYTSGVFRNNTAQDGGTITINSGNTSYNQFIGSGNYSNSGATFQRNVVNGNSQITITSGSFLNSTFTSSDYTQVANSGTISNSYIINSSSIINAIPITYSTLEASTINTTGSAGYISRCNIKNLAGTNMQNVPQLQWTYVTIDNYASPSITNATRCYLYMSALDTRGYITMGAGTTLISNYTKVSGNSNINVIGGQLTCNNTNIENSADVRNTIGVNTVQSCNVHSTGYIRFSGTLTDACNSTNNEVGSGGGILFNNAISSTILYSSASNNSTISATNSTNARLYYNSATASSSIRSTNQSAAHIMYYCSAISNGDVRMNNNTATNSTMYAISAQGQSIAMMQNSTGTNARWYYSTFNSYYYAYITLTTPTTFFGAFGIGRLTKTITDPVITNVGNTATVSYLDNF